MRIPHCAATVILFRDKSDQQQKTLEQEQITHRVSALARQSEGIFMAETAEQIWELGLERESELLTIEQTVLVEAVPNMNEDVAVRERAARFIGACLTAHEVEAPSYSNEALKINPIESLFDAIQQAAEGSEEARQMVATNVATDVIERTIKSGHVMKVDLSVDEAGRIQQFGQSMESVQANSLRHSSESWQMRERTTAEATNAFRINDLFNRGVLEEYNVVVFSRAADNMTEAEMIQAGFFTETMSCAIQVTTAQNDRLTTESAFVAGTRQAGAPRHDAETVTKVGQRLGVDLANKSAAETINTPLLVHKSLMPNGAIDLVALYDDCTGNTFFGETREAEDYAEFSVKCKEREAFLKPIVETITQKLIDESATITGRVHATQRLHKLSEKHMVQQAVFDHSINPAVFGPAAPHIESARIYWEQGEHARALIETEQAARVAVSSSCPDGRGKDSVDGTNNGDGQEKANDESGDCEFISKQCPLCHKKNVKTVISKGKISGSCGCTAKLK